VSDSTHSKEREGGGEKNLATNKEKEEREREKREKGRSQRRSQF